MRSVGSRDRAARLVTIVLAAACAASTAGAARADALARGAEVWELCAQCHGGAGGGNAEALAPPIAGLPAWYVKTQLQSFRSGARGLHPDDVGGLRMYPMSRSLKQDSDIEAVAAYVEQLPPVAQPTTVTGGDPAKGASYYATCTACHGPDGAGNEQLNAPPLRGQADWYLVESLHKFKAGARGYDPKNATATLMRGMSATLPDAQAIRDVVAHIATLSGRTAASGAAAAE